MFEIAKKLKEIVDRVLAFPSNNRAYLAEILLESLDFEEDFPINYEWIKEIKRRCKEIYEREIEMIAGEEGLAQLKGKY